MRALSWTWALFISSCNGETGSLHRFAKNPILEGGPDLADPSVLEFNGTLYLYPTGDQLSYDVYTLNLETPKAEWIKGPKVFSSDSFCPFSVIPSISTGNFVWAPHVIYHTESDKFYLYHTVCFAIGVAVADKPEGPFVTVDTLVRGAIDAFVLQDKEKDGSHSLYLYYNDVPSFQQGKLLFSAGMIGRKLASPVTLDNKTPVELFEANQAWEFGRATVAEPRGVVEAPWVTKIGAIYYLMYSGAGANGEAYRIGYATSSFPLGPFVKHAGNPIIEPHYPAEIGIYGPGHPAVWYDKRADQYWVFYHQKRKHRRGWDRFICADELKLSATGVLSLTVTRDLLEGENTSILEELQGVLLFLYCSFPLFVKWLVFRRGRNLMDFGADYSKQLLGAVLFLAHMHVRGLTKQCPGGTDICEQFGICIMFLPCLNIIELMLLKPLTMMAESATGMRLALRSGDYRDGRGHFVLTRYFGQMAVWLACVLGAMVPTSFLFVGFKDPLLLAATWIVNPASLICSLLASTFLLDSYLPKQMQIAKLE